MYYSLVLLKKKEKKSMDFGIMPSGRSLHANASQAGWMGVLAPGLGRVSG
jgi:hypothetical protein